jgi:hypothetical protein
VCESDVHTGRAHVATVGSPEGQHRLEPASPARTPSAAPRTRDTTHPRGCAASSLRKQTSSRVFAEFNPERPEIGRQFESSAPGDVIADRAPHIARRRPVFCLSGREPSTPQFTRRYVREYNPPLAKVTMSVLEPNRPTAGIGE